MIKKRLPEIAQSGDLSATGQLQPSKRKDWKKWWKTERTENNHKPLQSTPILCVTFVANAVSPTLDYQHTVEATQMLQDHRSPCNLERAESVLKYARVAVD